MPTYQETNLRKSGNSFVITAPKNYVNYLINSTGNKKPDVDIYGDSVLLIIPKDIQIDDHIEEGVIRLIKEVRKKRKNGNDKK